MGNHLRTAFSFKTISIFLFVFILFVLHLSGAPQKKESKMLKKAENHYFHKRYYIASRILNRIIEMNPENAIAYSYLGDIYLTIGKLNKAEENIRIAIELSRYPDKELFRLGQILYLKKKPTGALNAFRKALKINPGLHSCRFQMGLTYLKLLYNKKKTIEHWIAFRKLSPDDPQGPVIDRAIAILRRKDYVLKKEIVLPEGTDTRIPYKKGKPTGEKKVNKKEDIINIDDL